MSISFDDLAKLKVGDIIYECERGFNLKAQVLSVPLKGNSHGEEQGDQNRRTLSWKAENTENKDPIHYFVTEVYMHYGPRLYTEPQYVTRTKDGQFIALLVGTPK